MSKEFDLPYFPTQETTWFLSGPSGKLEVLSTPALEVVSPKKLAVICHPNPLQGGTMHNKVVFTASKALLAKGISTIRFNYRGVGESEGTYGNLSGELADLDTVMQWVKKVCGEKALLYLVGFSFGTYIAARWAIEHNWPIEQLFTIAPAVDRLNFDQLITNLNQKLVKKECGMKQGISWVTIQGEEDEVVPCNQVFKWFDTVPASLKQYMTLIKMPGTGHFFHGKLVNLREIMEKWIK